MIQGKFAASIDNITLENANEYLDYHHAHAKDFTILSFCVIENKREILKVSYPITANCGILNSARNKNKKNNLSTIFLTSSFYVKFSPSL